MKTKISALITCSLAFITSCEKDGNLISVSGLKSAELMSSESSVVLTKETSSSNVLALTWSKSDLTISDPSMKIPGSVPKEILEASASNNFENATEITPQGNTYSFTGAALNTLAKNLGFTAGESTPLYFRVRYGIWEQYGTVLQQCYYCKCHLLFPSTCPSALFWIPIKKTPDLHFILPTVMANTSGFTGSAAWYNWFLLEGDGTIWGNLGVDGNAFVLSSDESSFWNFWYPGQSGCYYTTLSTAMKNGLPLIYPR